MTPGEVRTAGAGEGQQAVGIDVVIGDGGEGGQPTGFVLGGSHQHGGAGVGQEFHRGCSAVLPMGVNGCGPRHRGVYCQGTGGRDLALRQDHRAAHDLLAAQQLGFGSHRVIAGGEVFHQLGEMGGFSLALEGLGGDQQGWA